MRTVIDFHLIILDGNTDPSQIPLKVWNCPCLPPVPVTHLKYRKLRDRWLRDMADLPADHDRAIPSSLITAVSPERLPTSSGSARASSVLRGDGHKAPAPLEQTPHRLHAYVGEGAGA